MGETYIFWRDIMNLFQTVKAAVTLRDAAEAEVEGIFLWAYAGLQRLKQNHFRFTESDRARENREAAKREHNNIFAFLALYPAEGRWFHPLQRPVCHLPDVV